MLRPRQSLGRLHDAMVSPDFPAHIQRLGHCDGTDPHVAGVRTEGVNQFVAQLVQRPGQPTQDATLHGLLHRSGQLRVSLRNLLYNRCGRLYKSLLETSPHTVQCSFLPVIQQRNLIAEKHVTTRRRKVWKKVRKSRLAVVTRLFHLLLGHEQALVIRNGQAPATVQAQHPLCPQSTGYGHQYQKSDKSFHWLYLLNHSPIVR